MPPWSGCHEPLCPDHRDEDRVGASSSALFPIDLWLLLLSVLFLWDLLESAAAPRPPSYRRYSIQHEPISWVQRNPRIGVDEELYTPRALRAAHGGGAAPHHSGGPQPMNGAVLSIACEIDPLEDVTQARTA